MLEPEALQTVARTLRRARLFASPSASERRSLGRADVEACLPHRGPMLLLDGIDAVDLEGGRLRAVRELTTDALGLEGHFPGAPIYPGVLQLEMVGQAGLCLAWLSRDTGPPIDARVVRIDHASFLAPVRPGERLTVEVARLAEDALTGAIAGQVCAGDEIKSTCVLEVYFVDAT